MIGSELVTRLKAELNQLDTSSNRTVRPEMALLFLNNAYLKLSRAKYKLSAGVVDDTAFQVTQLTTDELNHLTTSVYTIPVLSSDPEPVYTVDVATLPGYRYHLRSKIEIEYKQIRKWVSDISYKTLDTMNPTTLDPFNKPSPLEPVVYFESGKIVIPFSGFTVKNYYITYQKFPDQITLVSDCVAPFIDEIVTAAAGLILESWGDPRAQSILAINKVTASE